jgi:L-arabinose isomerase
VFSQNVSVDQLRAWAEVFGIECVHIGADTDPAQLKQMLRWGEAAWR